MRVYSVHVKKSKLSFNNEMNRRCKLDSSSNSLQDYLTYQSILMYHMVLSNAAELWGCQVCILLRNILTDWCSGSYVFIRLRIGIRMVLTSAFFYNTFVQDSNELKISPIMLFQFVKLRVGLLCL